MFVTKIKETVKTASKMTKMGNIKLIIQVLFNTDFRCVILFTHFYVPICIN